MKIMCDTPFGHKVNVDGIEDAVQAHATGVDPDNHGCVEQMEEQVATLSKIVGVLANVLYRHNLMTVEEVRSVIHWRYTVD